MIVTLTPSPSLDLTYQVQAGPPSHGEQEVRRARTVTLEASGKGINISRLLHHYGLATLAVFPQGGSSGAQLTDLLMVEGVPSRALAVGASTRINTTVLSPEEHSPVTKVNAPGSGLTRDEVRLLLKTTQSALAQAVATMRRRPAAVGPGDDLWLAICGTLPTHLPPETVAQVIALAHRAGALVAVDSSGPALRVALESGGHLLAPNHLELAELCDLDREGLREDPVAVCAAAASALATQFGTTLLVSLGAQGALWTDGSIAWHAQGPPITPVNPAGAGDALLAGWLSGSRDPIERLRTAVSWAQAACLSPSTVSTEPAPAGAADRIDVRPVHRDATRRRVARPAPGGTG